MGNVETDGSILLGEPEVQTMASSGRVEIKWIDDGIIQEYQWGNIRSRLCKQSGTCGERSTDDWEHVLVKKRVQDSSGGRTGPLGQHVYSVPTALWLHQSERRTTSSLSNRWLIPYSLV